MGLNIVLAYYFWYVLVSNYKELKTNDNFALETHSWAFHTPDLITSQRPHLQISPHWGFNFNT